MLVKVGTLSEDTTLNIFKLKVLSTSWMESTRSFLKKDRDEKLRIREKLTDQKTTGLKLVYNGEVRICRTDMRLNK